MLPGIVWAAGCVGSVFCLPGPLFFSSRQHVTLCCRVSHLSSSVWVENPPLTTPCSVLCPSLVFLLIWYLLWPFNLTRVALLWSTKPHGSLLEVSLQFGGNRFHLGRKGEAQHQVSISVHHSRSLFSAVPSCCLAGCEKFHFFSTYPFCLTCSCAWALDSCLVP